MTSWETVSFWRMTLPMGPFQPFLSTVISWRLSSQRSYEARTIGLIMQLDRSASGSGLVSSRWWKGSARLAVRRTCTCGRSLVSLSTVRSFDSPHITIEPIRIKSAPSHPPPLFFSSNFQGWISHIFSQTISSTSPTINGCLAPSRPALGHRIYHPPQSIAEVEERVELCLYPLCAFTAVYRVNFTFKSKVKFTQEQATKAQGESRCIALLFLQPQR